MKLKYEMNIVELDGEKVAVPVSYDGDFCGVVRINEVTADIFDALKEDVSEDDIVQKLLQEYDASEDTIKKSVKRVIDTLRENNLLVD